MIVDIIYKICPKHEWDTALAVGSFDGSAVDLADGYIHFSTAEQVAETAARHFRNQSDLVLVAVAAADLGDALKWEPSRGGDLFPHLYAPLPTSAAMSDTALTLGDDGVPVISASMLDDSRA